MRWKAIGPGLLFAGAAVGVSHLVQSTRAGAGFGLGLVGVVIAANLFKYPAFSFGPRFAAATGTSLLEGYRTQGRGALALYALVTVATMFTVEAAVTFMTAGLVVGLFGISLSPQVVSAGLLLLCAGILVLGHYRWLDRIMKVVVAALTLLTLAATALTLPRVPWGTMTIWPDGVASNPAALGFVFALVGWMPSAIDISVWHSLWSLARRRDTGYAPQVREALVDFDIGYIGTAVLALCFVVLGAGVVYGTGREIPPQAGPFASLVLDLYAEALGQWSRPIFGGAALMVMFSTTLTVVDGFPRALSALAARVQSGPEKTPEELDHDIEQPMVYWVSLVVLAGGSLLIVFSLLKSLLVLVDVATLLSFLTAPVLAILNHRAVFALDEGAPGRGMRVYSLVSIVVLTGFALYYLYLRVF